MAQSVVVMLSLVSSMVQCIQAKGSSEFNISSMDLFGFGHFLEVAFKYLHQNVVKLHNPDAGLRINTRFIKLFIYGKVACNLIVCV